ncbi:hypothetical protein BH23ACT11_BH23ACT11_29820 [soil metagenome]
MSFKFSTTAFLALGLLIALFGLTGSGGAAVAQSNTLDAEFRAASAEYEVPEELLKALGYVNTRWEMPPPDASAYEEGGPNEGSPEARGSYGIMNLMQNPSTNTLGKAAELTGLSEEELKTSRAANIRGGAAVLAASQEDQTPEDINAWFDTVSDYGGGPLYANQVYETLQAGASTETSSGETVTLEPQAEAKTQPIVNAQGSADYGRARWYGNGGNNYTRASRGRSNINKIVVHVTQGSFSSAINWFNDPGNYKASAHYTVRSSDGFIGQSVHEKDIAWHAGHWTTNKTSIGIEHEGYVSNSSYFTTKMYRSSARLSAYLSKKYRIPIDRDHIIGHNEVPGCSGSGGGAGCHTDPGRYWDWPRYMKLVRYYKSKYSGTSSNTYSQVVDNATRRFRATSDWDTNSWNPQKYKKNYRAIKPRRGTGSAKFLVRFPSRGKYVIYARWPAASKYNSRARFLIRTAGGWKLKVVNQRRNGGKWIRLGIYNMPAGDGSYVRLAKRSTANGYIIADAVAVRKVS